MSVIKERKKSTQNRKDRLPFEIWIFQNGQPNRDDDCRMFVVMTSTDRGIVYLCWRYDFMLCKNF